MQGSNISTTPTSAIQTALGGGLKVDNQYGPKTTAAVQQFQTANGLKVDGIFGPKTQAVFNSKYPNAGTTPPASNLITTSGPAQSTFNQNSSDLSAALAKYGAPAPTYDSTTGALNGPTKTEDPNNPSPTPDPILSDTTSGTSDDPYIQQLDAMSARSDTATQALINNIKSIKSRQSNAVDAQYNNYKSGLQLLGIQTNAASVTPDLLMSHINQAESEHQDKLATLDNEEIKALSDAQTAKDNNDFKTLNEKMTYLKQIRTEKTTALKNYQDALTTQAKNTQTQGDATAKVIAPDIYTTLQGLDPADQEPFLVSLSQKFNIPLNSLVTALVGQKGIQDKADLKTATADETVLTPTEAKALGVPYGTTRGEAAKLGITPKTAAKSKTVSSAAQLKVAEEEISNALKTGKDSNGNVLGNPRGSDGYVDPGIYVQAMEKWPGTQKEFLAKFPVKGTVNPASYANLPEAIRPKASTTASTDQTP